MTLARPWVLVSVFPPITLPKTNTYHQQTFFMSQTVNFFIIIFLGQIYSAAGFGQECHSVTDHNIICPCVEYQTHCHVISVTFFSSRKKTEIQLYSEGPRVVLDSPVDWPGCIFPCWYTAKNENLNVSLLPWTRLLAILGKGQKCKQIFIISSGLI